MTDEKKTTGLDRLMEPFEKSLISKKPVPMKWMTEEAKADKSKAFRCPICNGWHHRKAEHLDYVGHAALTSRLLESDPKWNWEPLAFTEHGTPALDPSGGMWIKLTVCDVTRLGYGHADGKKGGDATKEVIGDALRNAAMRFGAALDLWHKGDLHTDEPDDAPNEAPAEAPASNNPDAAKDAMRALTKAIDGTSDIAGTDMAAFAKAHANNWKLARSEQQDWLRDRMSKRAATLAQAPDKPLVDGEIKY